MATNVPLLKLFRVTHLYVGVFIAPAILFFAFTGALQTFSLHETTRGSDYKPPAWAVILGQLHKKQTITVPPPRAAQAQPRKDAGPEALKPPVPSAAPRPPEKSHLPMKIFFLTVAIGLFTSTLTGIYMAYKYNSNKIVVTGLLVAGIVIPFLLLPF